MENVQVNFLAVLVAAIAYFVIGGLWYSPLLFARPWMAALGVTEDELKKSSPVPGYVVSLIGAFLAAFVMAMFIEWTDTRTLQSGLTTSFFIWLGFVATTTAPPYFFEDRPKGVYVIYAGYTFVGFLVMGTILALW